MRIAIMTWYSQANYGTALQAVALAKVLEEKGNIVKIIAYKPKMSSYQIADMGMFRYGMYKLSKKLNYILNPNIVAHQAGHKFDVFLHRHLQFTEQCMTYTDLYNLNEKFDLFICGSDQIWSPLLFDSHYYLDFVRENKRKVAYAPSIGINKIESKMVASLLEKYTHDFERISVRESTGAKLLSDLIGKKIPDVLDPTLLLNETEWKHEFYKNRKAEKYILAYFLGDGEHNWKKFYKLAHYYAMPIKIIPVHKKDLRRKGEICTHIGPEEFLDLIFYAEVVCTDSFHGIAFSVNFKKNFFAFMRFKNGSFNNQNSRILDLLNELDLTNRILGDIKEDDFFKIDYSKVNEKLNTKRDISKGFLFGAIDSLEKVEGAQLLNNIYAANKPCCGCGVCKNVCPVNAISINKNEKGFFVAKVDKELCISCGICRINCPFEGDLMGKSLIKGRTYSYKDADIKVLNESSSGGVAFRISRLYSEQGYDIIGSVFDYNKLYAKHELVKAEDVSQLKRFQGSKYIQSSFEEIFTKIKDKHHNVMIFGTPCQIAACRKYLCGYKNIKYVDLICHGVPSYNLFDKYLQSLRSGKKLKGDVKKIVFRSKEHGWRKRIIKVDGMESEYKKSESEDDFFLMYKYGLCYSDACYECRWRDWSAADIRIGDYWGSKFENDKTGVSMVISLTPQGDDIIKNLMVSVSGIIAEESIEDYFVSQQTKNVVKNINYDHVMALLCDQNVPLHEIVHDYALALEYLSKYRRFKSYVRRRIKKK